MSRMDEWDRQQDHQRELKLLRQAIHKRGRELGMHYGKVRQVVIEAEVELHRKWYGKK